MLKLAGDSYFKPKKFESDGKIYELIGIRAFRKMVFLYSEAINELFCFQSTELGSAYHIPEHSIEGIKKFEKKRTRYSETVHLFGFLGFGSYILFIPDNPLAYACAIQQLYCVFLQRYNRCRINNILNVQKELDLPDSAIEILPDLQYKINSQNQIYPKTQSDQLISL